MEFFSNERNNTLRVLKEATFVGLLTALIGYVASALVKPYFKIDLPEICKSWKERTLGPFKLNIMEASLFVTGFLLHLFLEFTGLNKSYAMYRANIA
jgi:hypothetical protein